MVSISRDSDVELKLTLKEGDVIIKPSDLKISFELRSSGGYEVVSGHGGWDAGGTTVGPQNCYRTEDGNSLMIMLEKDSLKAGSVEIRACKTQANENFNDGTKSVWTSWVHAGLTLL